MESNTALIIGSGHLADRVKKLVHIKGYSVTHIYDLNCGILSSDISILKKISQSLIEVEIANLSIIYILDDKDEFNLETVLALITLHPESKICISLFNENLRPHLLAAHPKLHIINPAAQAAPCFVAALYAPLKMDNHILSVNQFSKSSKPSSDKLLKLLILSFIAIILLAITYFHYHEQISWLDSFYFVVVTVSTVGYGDFNLQHATPISKIIGILLILSSTIFIWLIFSFIIDRMIKTGVERSMGKKRYRYKNHIIICGLGRLGFFIADELYKKGEKILIIEPNDESPNIQYFRNLGVAVYTGNARLPGILQNACVHNARALIAATNDDYTNLEIGLNARTYHPNLRLILRIFDDSMAQIIQEKMNIHLTLSMSAIADESFASLLEPYKLDNII